MRYCSLLHTPHESAPPNHTHQEPQTHRKRADASHSKNESFMEYYNLLCKYIQLLFGI